MQGPDRARETHRRIVLMLCYVPFMLCFSGHVQDLYDINRRHRSPCTVLVYSTVLQARIQSASLSYSPSQFALQGSPIQYVRSGAANMSTAVQYNILISPLCNVHEFKDASHLRAFHSASPLLLQLGRPFYVSLSIFFLNRTNGGTACSSISPPRCAGLSSSKLLGPIHNYPGLA